MFRGVIFHGNPEEDAEAECKQPEYSRDYKS
jgi:hypothetical protein